MRFWKLWTALGLVAAVAILGTAALTYRLFELESDQRQAQREAFLEENVRLALWRIDSQLAPFLSQAVAVMGEPGGKPFSNRLNRAVLGVADNAWMQQVIEIHGSGRTSVLANFRQPSSKIADKAESATDAGLVEVVSPTEWKGLLDALKEVLPPPQPEPSQTAANFEPQNADQQIARNSKEYSVRSRIVRQQANEPSQSLLEPGSEDQLPSQVAQLSPGGATAGIWWKDDLLIARAWNANGVTVRALVLDWPKVKTDLLALVTDILPNAALLPARNPATADKARMLASLPILIDPGTVVFPGEDNHTLRLLLILAWTALALAILATAVLVRGLVALSERRAAFVSSVTHELRTPLTTLRMYAEMLAEDIVRDPAQRKDYLATLRTEADRLGTLVENVLSYARLERQPAKRTPVPVPLASISSIFDGRIRQRAEESGFTLRMESLASDSERADPLALPPSRSPALSPSSSPRPIAVSSNIDVLADPAAVEQVFFNLVDNACKYAADGREKTIDVSFEVGSRNVAILVTDHGRGISKEGCKSLFRPFSRSPRTDSPATPGVGLGLALSRQLARQMSGDLRLRRSDANGTCFELELKRVRDS